MIEIREACQSDRHDVFRLGQQLSPGGDVNLITCGYEAEKVVLVAERYGKVMATLTIFMFRRSAGRRGVIAQLEDVVVDETFRRTGIGKQLVTHAIQCAKEHGCYKVVVNCSDANRSFYESCGLSYIQNQLGTVF